MPPWKRNLVVLWSATWVTATGMWAMVPFLTYVVEELGVADPVRRNLWTGLLVGAAPVMSALMGPVWGGVGDRFGRKAMVLRAIGAIAVFVGLMGFARSAGTLLVLRLLQGAFSGYVPPSITLVSVQAPVERQGTAAGILQSAMHGGAVTGFLLGGSIAARGSMRVVFPVCALLAVAGFAVVLLLVDEGARPGRRVRWRPRAILRDIAGDYRYVLELRPLVRFLSCVVVVRALVSSTNPSFARYVEAVGGDRSGVGYLFCAEAVMLFAFLPLWGRVLEGVGPRRVFAVCAFGLAGSFAGQASVDGYVPLVLWRLLSGASQAGVLGASYAMAARASSPARRGGAVGAVFMGLALSHAGGSALGGPLLNLLGFRALLGAVAGASFLVGGFAVIESRRRRGTRERRQVPGPADQTGTISAHGSRSSTQ